MASASLLLDLPVSLLAAAPCVTVDSLSQEGRKAKKKGGRSEGEGRPQRQQLLTVSFSTRQHPPASIASGGEAGL